MRRNGLRDGPFHGVACCPAGGGDGEALGSAPEGAGGVVAGQAGVGVDVSGDVDGVWRGSKANDFSVEADWDVDVIIAGKKEQGVACGTELAVLLNGIDLVDLGLNLRCGHGGIEDEGVRTEVLLCGRGDGRGCEGAKKN